MSTLTPPTAPKGHRRVKSLVREFDEIIKIPATSPTGASPPVSPSSPSRTSYGPPAPAPTSPTPPNRQPQATHVRRAASVSYSSSSLPLGGPLPLASPPFTFKSSAFSPSNPTTTMRSTSSPESVTAAAAGANAAAIKRRVSAGPSLFVSPPEPPELKVVSEVPSRVEQTEIDREEEDIFLPMTPTPGPVLSAKLPSPGMMNGSAQQHARKHSRIHERNLSAFFPRPGQGAGPGYGDTYEDPNGSGRMGGVSDIPGASPDTLDEIARNKAAARRGHHHRHSLSHNFSSSLLDSNDPNALSGLSPPFTPGTPGTPMVGSNSNFLPAPSFSPRAKYAHVPAPLRLVLFIALYLPLGTQLALALSVAQIVLGASLWIVGQSGESLSVTGLGYLVVFDGMGGLSGILVEGGPGVDALWALWGGVRLEKGIRMPFGTQRLVTLSLFSQAIYLLFSAVYVCKESVEHVLLLHGGKEEEGAHGVGHGMGGHGEGGVSNVTSGLLDAGIVLPILLLGLSAAFSFVSAIALRNHQTLSDAVGPSSFARPRSRTSAPSVLDLVGNPFTLTVLIFSIGLLTSAFVIPSAQLAPLDKVVALLQSIAMFYVAYPAAVATGQVLLQTSPPPHAAQMTHLTNGLRDIENHPLVVKVTSPHVWQLTPHPSSSSAPSSAPRRSSRPGDVDAATLIATLIVAVKPDCSDNDILQVTKFARERCTPALRFGSETNAGVAPGELTVSVVRGERRGVVKFFDHASMHGTGAGEGSAAGHGGHEHSGGHSHQH